MCAKRDDRQESVERSDGLGQKRTKQTRMMTLNALCLWVTDCFRSWTRDPRGPDTHNIGFSFARCCTNPFTPLMVLANPAAPTGSIHTSP